MNDKFGKILNEPDWDWHWGTPYNYNSMIRWRGFAEWGCAVVALFLVATVLYFVVHGISTLIGVLT